ncbi:mRNA 3'-end-processing protein rna14 [Gryganskiella cystojenkinii]|nr:mRNA 3'-end-processing protein rna14 [Gryganskiella cystojenkinii]
MDSPSENRSPATNSGLHSRDVSVDITTPVPSTPDRPVNFDIDEVLEQRINEDPFDTDAWLTVLHEAEREGEVAKVREAYERFLKVFPTSSRHWIQYAEFELKHQHFTEVEAIFQRCLRSVLSVELWKFYLNYIRRINTGPESKEIVTKSYDFVLQHVGLDRDSGPIWSDYLFFLKSGQAQNTWEEQQKMDAMRRVFQRAVCIPLSNIENIWRDYDSFENGLNKLTAKKFLQERSAGYMTARMMLKELRKLTEGINKTLLPRPVKWTERELHQLEQWKRYIRWERSNPLSFEDPAALSARVAWTYKQALLSMRFYPEIWFEAATYFSEIGRVDESVALLKNATEIMPTSFLVHFAYVEMEESRKNFKECRAAFEALIKNLTQKIDEMNNRVNEEIQAAKAKLLEEQQALDGSTTSTKKVRDIEEVDGEMRERDREELKKRNRDLVLYEKLARKEVDEMIKGAGLAWIMFMQFVRRTEGTSQWRQVFGRARRSNGCPYQVYIAAALLEYHCTKDRAIAGKVFELGYKNFSDETAYVEQYLEFLIQQNDDSNARALFERALITMSPDKARSLWEKFSEYENKYGDLVAITKVEKRRREVYPNDSVLDRFAARYCYNDLKVIEEMDMGASIRKNIHVPALTDFSSDFPPPPPVDLDNASRPGRRPLMEPVHADLYPRPDFGMWSSYRVYPDMIRKGPQSSRESHARPGDMDTIPQPHSDRVKIERDDHDVGIKGPNGYAPRPPIPPQLAPSLPQQAIPSPSSHQTPPMIPPPMPPQPPQAPLPPLPPLPIPGGPPLAIPGWTAGPHGLIPDALAFFLSNLPPASVFNGPVLAPQEVLELVRSSQIPAGQTMMIPPPILPGAPVPPPPQTGLPMSGPGGSDHRAGGGGGGRDMGPHTGYRGGPNDRDGRDIRDGRDGRDSRDSYRDHRDSRERDRDPRDMRDARDPRDTRDPRDAPRNDRIDRGGRGGGSDRGGFRPRGGPSGGGGRGGAIKRSRGRDDDEMGGSGGGGGDYNRNQMPGVNRPPEYDLFRARQQRKMD